MVDYTVEDTEPEQAFKTDEITVHRENDIQEGSVLSEFMVTKDRETLTLGQCTEAATVRQFNSLFITENETLMKNYATENTMCNKPNQILAI